MSPTAEGLNPSRVFAFSVVFLLFALSGHWCSMSWSPQPGQWVPGWAQSVPSPGGSVPVRCGGSSLLRPLGWVFQLHCRKTASPVTTQAPALHQGSQLHDVPPLPLPGLQQMGGGPDRAGGRERAVLGHWVGQGWWSQPGVGTGLGSPRPLRCPLPPPCQGLSPGPPRLPPWLQPAPGGFAAPPGSVAPGRRNLK